MANFCSNCGNKVEPDAKFCTSCGARLEAEAEPVPGTAPPAGGGVSQPVNTGVGNVIEQREARIDVDISSGSKGHLLLTRDELIFMEGKRLEQSKERLRVPLSQIKSARKLPLTSRVDIVYNVAPQGAGLVRRAMGRKECCLSITDAKSFIEKLKGLNPNIK